MKANNRNWKLERAAVHHRSAARSKSNKYSKSDDEERPRPHSRTKVWVGAYTRRDGRKVEGHFRYPKIISHLIDSKMQDEGVTRTAPVVLTEDAQLRRA